MQGNSFKIFFFFFLHREREKAQQWRQLDKKWCLLRWEEVQHVSYNERKEEKESERRGLTQERSEGQ